MTYKCNRTWIYLCSVYRNKCPILHYRGKEVIPGSNPRLPVLNSITFFPPDLFIRLQPLFSTTPAPHFLRALRLAGHFLSISEHSASFQEVSLLTEHLCSYKHMCHKAQVGHFHSWHYARHASIQESSKFYDKVAESVKWSPLAFGKFCHHV